MSEPVPTIDVLRSAGFADDPAVVSDDPGGLSIDFENLALSASFCLNRSLQPVVMLNGIYRTKHTISEMERERASFGVRSQCNIDSDRARGTLMHLVRVRSDVPNGSPVTFSLDGDLSVRSRL